MSQIFSIKIIPSFLLIIFFYAFLFPTLTILMKKSLALAFSNKYEYYYIYSIFHNKTYMMGNYCELSEYHKCVFPRLT